MYIACNVGDLQPSQHTSRLTSGFFYARGFMFIWTIGDVITASIMFIGVVVAIAIKASTAIGQSQCKHDAGFNETSACDAICRKCGKNMGFIGALKR